MKIARKSLQEWRAATWNLMVTTPAEVFAAAGLGMLTLGYYGYIENAAKAGSRPVAFSEVGKTVKAAKERGEEVGPLTLANARCNDGLMKVNEANNYAAARGNSHQAFAAELDYRISPELRIHRLLTEEAKGLQEVLPAAMGSLGKYTKSMAELPPVTAAFNSAWKYSTRDVNENYDCSYDSCTTDSKGNRSCRRVQKTCTRYSHTWHTFTFNRQAATAADQKLQAYLSTNPDLSIAERLVYSRSTSADNEYAIEKSFRKELKGAIPSVEQALQYANLWASASNFEMLRGPIEQMHGGLKPLSSSWTQLVPDEKSRYHFRTGSRSDSGPPGYRLSRKILSQTSELNSATSQVVLGLQSCSSGLNQIVSKSVEYVGVVLDKKPGKPSQLRDDILDLQEKTFRANFAAGPKQNRFDRGEVLLYALGGLLGGGLLGLGLDRLVNLKARALRQGVRPRY